MAASSSSSEVNPEDSRLETFMQEVGAYKRNIFYFFIAKSFVLFFQMFRNEPLHIQISGQNY